MSNGLIILTCLAFLFIVWFVLALFALGVL